MLIRFDPFREVDRLSRNQSGPSRPTWMSMDAYRQGDQVVAHLDVPGVDPASIDVTVDSNVLTVKAQRTWERAEGDAVLASERPQGSFTRRLLLGENLDGDRIVARYDNGVLTLTVPVAEQAKPRKVEITTGGQADGETETQPVAA
jgi:HSP20 family protein